MAVQLIVNLLSLFAAVNQSGPLEYVKMMGDGGLAHVKGFADGHNAELLVLEHLQNSLPGPVRKGLKYNLTFILHNLTLYIDIYLYVHKIKKLGKIVKDFLGKIKLFLNLIVSDKKMPLF